MRGAKPFSSVHSVDIMQHLKTQSEQWLASDSPPQDILPKPHHIPAEVHDVMKR